MTDADQPTPVEIELKLLAPHGDLDPEAVAASAADCGVTLEPGDEREQVDVYLDDARRRLAAAGAGLRMRSKGSACWLTLKFQPAADSDTALHRREEIETEWDGPLPSRVDDLPALLARRVEPLLGDAALQPLIELHNLRSKRIARIGPARAELCLDRCTARARPDAAPHSFQELEIEILDGADVEPWQRWARHLAEHLALEPSRLSKLERGLGLVGAD